MDSIVMNITDGFLINEVKGTKKEEAKRNAMKVVKKYNLKHVSKVRTLVYMRVILTRYLRDNKITFQEIGEILNRGHSSIIHFNKRYDVLVNYDDFKALREAVYTDLGLEKTLEDKVLECKDYWQMVQLQEEIKKKRSIYD